MLIGTEALRESIAALQHRVKNVGHNVSDNDIEIDNNDHEINDNRTLVNENRTKLDIRDGKITDLEHNYGELHQRLSADRETLIMMCHQYAYADSVPEQCDVIIGKISEPVPYRWNFPQKPAEEEERNPKLPPYAHEEPKYEFVSAYESGPSARKLA